MRKTAGRLLGLLLALVMLAGLMPVRTQAAEGYATPGTLKLVLPEPRGPFEGAVDAIVGIEGGEHYTLTAYWYNGGKPETHPGAGLAPYYFEEGKLYFAELYLDAEEGYYFRDDPEFTLDGAEVRDKKVVWGGKRLYICTEDITLTIPDGKCTVTWIPGDGTGEKILETVGKGTQITVKGFPENWKVPNGLHFAGWNYTEAGGEPFPLNVGWVGWPHSIGDNAVFTAYYQNVVEGWKDNGLGGVDTGKLGGCIVSELGLPKDGTVLVEPGSTTNVMVLMKEGYRLKKNQIQLISADGKTVLATVPMTWNEEDDSYSGDFKMPSQDVSLRFATEKAKYTVSFNANSGSGSMAPVTVTAGEKLKLPQCTFTPPSADKVFDRWDAGKPGDMVDIGSDCTITALWKVKPADPPQPEPDPEPQPQSIPMHRLYYPGTHEHLYTSDAYEVSVLTTPERGWEYEGIAWQAPAAGEPVYRLFNPYSTDHHYTMDYNEYMVLGSKGWEQEGIGWYSDPGHGVPLYRLFTKALDVGAHHYTADAYERSVLLNGGAWIDEGIGWYGLK